MLALELVKPGEGDGRVPNPELTKRIQAEALERRLIVLTAGTYVNVIRVIPPLVTTREEVELALAILDESLTAAGAQRRDRIVRRGLVRRDRHEPAADLGRVLDVAHPTPRDGPRRLSESSARAGSRQMT